MSKEIRRMRIGKWSDNSEHAASKRLHNLSMQENLERIQKLPKWPGTAKLSNIGPLNGIATKHWKTYSAAKAFMVDCFTSQSIDHLTKSSFCSFKKCVVLHWLEESLLAKMFSALGKRVNKRVRVVDTRYCARLDRLWQLTISYMNFLVVTWPSWMEKYWNFSISCAFGHMLKLLDEWEIQCS